MNNRVIPIDGAKAAKLLMLHYLLSDLGRKKEDFLCGISSEGAFRNFLEESSKPVHSSYYVNCTSIDEASKCMEFMKKAGFRQTDRLEKEGGTLVFIYKIPDNNDSRYLEILNERIEKSGKEFESLVK